MGSNQLIRNLLRELVSKNKTVAIAESCSGGLLAKSITDVPGASRCFVGGVVSYANTAKTTLLGVRKKVLDKHGAVSGETACRMANNIREKLNASLGISITGIAGPGGGSLRKPVGLVYIGVSDHRKTQPFRFLFSGSRSVIRRQSVKEALKLIWRWARKQ